MSHRLDILIIPDDHHDLGVNALGPGATTARVGDYEIIFRGDFRRQGARGFIGGRWPEALGLHLTIDTTAQRWTIESDRYGICPLYHARTPGGKIAISTRPELLARLIKSDVDETAVATQLLIGYTLDETTIFRGVERLRPRTRIAWAPIDGLDMRQVPVPAARPSGAAWWEALAPTLSEARERDAMLELSGGVDSRFVLAVARTLDCMPRRAFTIGTEQDEDVRIARLIARKAGLEHTIIAPPSDAQPPSISSAGTFVRRAGFGVNATSSAWLPDVFDQLAALRDAQIGGGGGETASGYYDAPLDLLVGSDRTARWWIAHRLFRPGVDLTTILRPEAAHELRERVMAHALAIFDRGTDSWRERGYRFYLTQRMPNGGGPVLAASSAWYLPMQPLLERVHVEWTRSLGAHGRHGRTTQLARLAQLDPELARIPFSGGRRISMTTTGRILHGAGKIVRTARKISRRVLPSSSPTDLGATAMARAFASNGHVRDAIGALVSRGAFAPEAVEQTLAHPEARAHEIGVLVTAALAHHAATVSVARPAQRSTTRAATPTKRRAA